MCVENLQKQYNHMFLTKLYKISLSLDGQSSKKIKAVLAACSMLITFQKEVMWVFMRVTQSEKKKAWTRNGNKSKVYSDRNDIRKLIYGDYDEKYTTAWEQDDWSSLHQWERKAIILLDAAPARQSFFYHYYYFVAIVEVIWKQLCRYW